MQIEELKQAAQAGDAKSQFLLGRHFFAGHLLPQDFQQALHWYQKAADQHHAEALLNLGKMYEQGQAGQPDLPLAVECYRKAAALAQPEAQYMLSLHYQLAQGTDRDDKLAFDWCRKAADQGYPNAQFMMGSMFAAGLSVEPDQAEANKWYRLAANNGYPAAQYEIGTMEEKYSLAEAEKWYRQAAEQDYAPAQYRMGSILLSSNRAAALPFYTGIAFHLLELQDDGLIKSVDAEVKRCLQAADDACGELQHDEAAQWGRLASMMAAQGGIKAPHLAPLLAEIGRNLQHAGMDADAEVLFVEALSLLRDGSDEALTAELFGRLGQMYASRGDLHKAEQTLREAVSSYEVMGVQDQQFADLLNALAVVYIRLEKQSLAVPLLRRCTALVESLHGNSTILAQVLAILGAACLSTGYMLKEAEDAYRRVLTIFDDNGLGDSPQARTVLDILASLLDHLERPEEAERMRSRAAAITAVQ